MTQNTTDGPPRRKMHGRFTSGGVSPTFDGSGYVLRLGEDEFLIDPSVAQAILRGLLKSAVITLPNDTENNT